MGIAMQVFLPILREVADRVLGSIVQNTFSMTDEPAEVVENTAQNVLGSLFSMSGSNVDASEFLEKCINDASTKMSLS
ncbi:MAG: hypothetical protein RMI01_10400, partial [Thermodesulfovibrio sp.]|nr:hypothetical protein [Thermodesulfovibrio sp.]